jgi:hypothetical protein
LPGTIRNLEEAGYDLVTLTEVLEPPPPRQRPGVLAPALLASGFDG